MAGWRGYVGRSRFEDDLPARSTATAGASRMLNNGQPSIPNGSSELQVNRRPSLVRSWSSSICARWSGSADGAPRKTVDSTVASQPQTPSQRRTARLVFHAATASASQRARELTPRSAIPTIWRAHVASAAAAKGVWQGCCTTDLLAATSQSADESALF